MSGKKFDNGKLRYDLIPHESLEEVARIVTFGAAKYGDENWRDGFNYKRLYAATQRHLNAWFMGQDFDPESGVNHLAHAVVDILYLIAHQKNGYGIDDRVKTKQPEAE